MHPHYHGNSPRTLQTAPYPFYSPASKQDGLGMAGGPLGPVRGLRFASALIGACTIPYFGYYPSPFTIYLQSLLLSYIVILST